MGSDQCGEVDQKRPHPLLPRPHSVRRRVVGQRLCHAQCETQSHEDMLPSLTQVGNSSWTASKNTFLQR